MRISLTTTCPTCRVAGTTKRLFKELGDEQVKCDAGHAFPTVEAAEAGLYVPAHPPAATDVRKASQEVPAAPQEHTRPPQAPQPPAKEKPAPEPPREASQAPSMELEPVPAVKEEEPFYRPEPRRPQAHLDDSYGVQQKATEIETSVAIAEPEIAPPVRDARTRELILGVRIPEQYVSSLLAESENQHETVQEYFQRIVEWGLEAGWFY